MTCKPSSCNLLVSIVYIFRHEIQALQNAFKIIDWLYLMASKKYIQLASTFQSKNANIKSDELDILELFAQKPYLSINQISSFIKSTPIEMAYKNVHSKVQRLKGPLRLIELAEIERRKIRNNEKFYRLTEEGIYQLFLKRIDGILIDQFSVIKGQKPLSNVKTFLQYYGDSALFESFLYPYFCKETISTENLNLLSTLFYYIHDCCKQVDTAIRVASVVPIRIAKFSWNKIPGKDNMELLMSLKEIFGLDSDIDNTNIGKTNEDNVLKITTSQISILIELDLERMKAIATLDKDNRKYEYDVLKLGSDLNVCTTQPTQESINKILDDRNVLEIPIYRLICNLGRSDNNVGHDSLQILSADDKFMRLVEDMHVDFEKGYNKLMNLRISS
jgi:hypothetical protein